MNKRIQRILAVIDPTSNDQWALRKALAVAGQGEAAEVTAYACIFSFLECEDVLELKRAEMSRYEPWLDDIISNLDKGNVKITARIDWDPDWREAIHIAAADVGADLVVKRASGRSNLLSNSDRRVLRTVKGDVLLVKREPRKKTARILVALNPNARDDTHMKLDEMIVGAAKRIEALQPGLEIHAVSAYRESDHFVHPTDLASKAGISRARAHVHQGTSTRVISDTARELDVDVVIIGNVGRKGIAGFTLGNTAEKILAGVNSDVLVVSDKS